MSKEGEGLISDTENERVHLLKKLKQSQADYVVIYKRVSRIIRKDWPT